MGNLVTGSRRTRRQFLSEIVGVGIGVAAMAGLTTPAAVAAPAQVALAARPKVLLEDVVERSAADFARGQARGLQIVAEAGRALLRGRAGGEFVSGVVTLPFPATHLGLHWVLRADSPEAVAVAVRTSADRQQWSEWYPLTVEAVAERPEGREVFAALAPGGGDFAQYKMVFPADEATVDGMTVTAINTAGGAPQPAPASTLSTVPLTSRTGVSINVIPREAWGCDEGLVVQKLGKSRDTLWPEMYVPAKKVIIHHTATSNNYSNGAAEVVAVWSYHAITLGWGDVGYNVLIDKYGNIYEGRHGRGEDPATREIMSADVIAGHCYHHNYGTTGISAVGNYQTAQPPQALKNALDAVTAFEFDRHYIQPQGLSDFLRSDNVWHDALNNISGHYESYSTSCPGRNLEAYLPTLRSHVAAALGSSTTHSAEIPQWGPLPARDLTAGADAAFTWSGGYTKYFYCFEGWYKHADSEDVDYVAGYAADPNQGGDGLAVVQAWTEQSGGSLTTPALAAGQYTLHVRGEGGLYEASHTILVKPSGLGGKPSVKIESITPDEAVLSVLKVAVAASDGEDAVGDLHVFVGADLDIGGTVSKIWRLARYNGATYNVQWDTSGLLDGSQHTIDAHATDSAGNTVKAASVTATVGASSGGGDGDPKYVHVGDLDGSAAIVNKRFWNASVVVTVHDASCQPVANATVTGAWSGTKTGTASGTTGSDGTVTLSTGNMSSGTEVTFTVHGIAGTDMTYDASKNHDPDSDGTSIAINKS